MHKKCIQVFVLQNFFNAGDIRLINYDI